MHTQPTPGIDTELPADLERSFSWVPPLATDSCEDDYLAGPESITDEELAAAFDELKREKAEAGSAVGPIAQLDDSSFPRVLDGNLYGWDELHRLSG